MIDLEKLDAGLNKLTGRDLESAELEERAQNNGYPMIEFTNGFRIRLAAKALGVNHHDLRDLPAKEYQAICRRVTNFLNDSASTELAT